jgi:hypothetical protein
VEENNMGRTCSTHDDAKCEQNLFRSLEGRLLGRFKRRWEDNIKIGLEAVGWEGVSNMHLA